MFNAVFKGGPGQNIDKVCSCTCWCSCSCGFGSPQYATFNWDGYTMASGPGEWFGEWT